MATNDRHLWVSPEEVVIAYGTRTAVDSASFNPVHVRGDDIGPFLAERLKPNRSEEIAEHMDECCQCRNELYEVLEYGRIWAANALRGRDRRHEVRYAVEYAGHLRVLKPYSRRLLPVVLKDLSNSGMRIDVPLYIPSETLVQVFTDTAILIGEIRYCLSVEERFDVGVYVEVVHYAKHRSDGAAFVNPD